jgi:hypothetical protein
MGSIGRFWSQGISPLLVAVLALGGCGGSGSLRHVRAAPAPAQPVQLAAASCAALTPAQRLAAAKVVFDGVILPGPLAPLSGAVLASPAQVRVQRYLKGSGPSVVLVQTAMSSAGSGAVRVDAEGIRPRSGERWEIHASTASQPYASSICLGSRRLTDSLRRFVADGIRFAYPDSWNARRYTTLSTMSSWIVWLSPQSMHNPCVTHHGTKNTTISCNTPIEQLAPHSLLASWTTNGNPAWRFDHVVGTPITVGGRRAKWSVQQPPTGPPSIGADESIDVVIPVPHTTDSWYQLSVLIRGPDLRSLTRQVRALVRSVRWV